MAEIFDAYGNPVRASGSSGGPVMQEIASAARDDVAGGWLGELRSFSDEILSGQLGGNLRAYRKILDDWQVQSTLQQRRRAITSREWDIQAGGKRKADQMAADWLRDVAEHVGWDSAVDKMFFGIHYGYAVAELLYARDGRYIIPDKIKVRDRYRFRYDRDYRLRLITPETPLGEVMPPRKFWVFAAGADVDDDPYGVGLAHYLYWPALFKRQGVSFYLRFMERWAAPTPVGKYPPGTPPAEQKKLLAALSALVTDGAIILPEGMDVDKFEALRTGTGSYEPFLSYMDRAISKIVLSQTMTTDAASTGLGSTQGEVQAGVAEDVQKGDSDLICGSFNAGTAWAEAPLKWLTEWNFPGAEPPQIWYSFDEPDDLNQTAERDQKLYVAGWVRTQESQDEAYGKGYVPRTPLLPPAAPRGGGPPALADFAEGNPNPPAMGGAAADAYAEHLRGQAGELVAGWVDQVRRLLRDAGSLAEFSERMIELYPTMSADALAAVMADAMTASHLAGRYEVAIVDRQKEGA